MKELAPASNVRNEVDAALDARMETVVLLLMFYSFGFWLALGFMAARGCLKFFLSLYLDP